MTELTELKRLEKNVADAKAVADAAEEAYAVARDELTEYRNYKKAQLIKMMTTIVIRHDMETT